ncbi:hypothetical protein [Kitasatospora cathayae]|uniref:Uncharacterized protein n=1 Tax=Kitasatospora cathayae TaxID=3004092 RepID=A0ABY7QE34_9ACTN|nr:hypothetical protein [Kitasatospora sp. HUAS 3-15]WBP90806.1 hypothetical protein O1G21_36380 [Kitasatospora sp. HUAS 3-15]
MTPQMVPPPRKGLFGALYELSDQGEIDFEDLVADVEELPQRRRLWSSRALEAHEPGALLDSGILHTLHTEPDGARAGAYDPAAAAVLVGENTADKAMPLPEQGRLPRSCPPRQGLVPRAEAMLQVASAAVPMPSTPTMAAFAEIGYGWAWCQLDDTVLCRRCVSGQSMASCYGTFPDYHHFVSGAMGVMEDCARLTAGYVRHCLVDHEDPASRLVMDNWMITLQAVYLDVLHEKATSPRFGADESRALKYRLINSGIRPLALAALLEGTHKGPADDALVDAVSLLALCAHEALDRRHDNCANEAYNLFSIVAAHHGVDSAGPLGRFCVDVLAWAVDHGSRWPLLLSGRQLIWQVYQGRYQSALLLDNLARDPGRLPGDLYCDPVLNSLNPLLIHGAERTATATAREVFSVRSRCRDRAAYDRLVADCLEHFAGCGTCRGFDTAAWQARPAAHITPAYLAKHAGDCRCLNTMAVYAGLVLFEQALWAADAAGTYTGPTADWDPLLC